MSDHCGPEHLHAPWRMEYIEQAEHPRGGCIFCDKPCQDCDRDNYIVHRGDRCFIILNAFPYNSGHLMVIPYQHTSELDNLPPETQLEMMRLTTLAIRALRQVMCPDGFNIGINVGHAAGAGIAEHVHLHVVPRWVGDTNFMTATGNTRVLPESLVRTWEKICAAFQRLADQAGG